MVRLHVFFTVVLIVCFSLMMAFCVPQAMPCHGVLRYLILFCFMLCCFLQPMYVRRYVCMAVFLDTNRAICQGRGD